MRRCFFGLFALAAALLFLAPSPSFASVGIGVERLQAPPDIPMVSLDLVAVAPEPFRCTGFTYKVTDDRLTLASTAPMTRPLRTDAYRHIDPGRVA